MYSVNITYSEKDPLKILPTERIVTYRFCFCWDLTKYLSMMWLNLNKGPTVHQGHVKVLSVIWFEKNVAKYCKYGIFFCLGYNLLNNILAIHRTDSHLHSYLQRRSIKLLQSRLWLEDGRTSSLFCPANGNDKKAASAPWVKKRT